LTQSAVKIGAAETGTTDGRGRVRITDFGLAAFARELALPGRAGTPAYMAPELFRAVPASTRSDVDALGALLYELFTGPLTVLLTLTATLYVVRRRWLAVLVSFFVFAITDGHLDQTGPWLVHLMTVTEVVLVWGVILFTLIRFGLLSMVTRPRSLRLVLRFDVGGLRAAERDRRSRGAVLRGAILSLGYRLDFMAAVQPLAPTSVSRLARRRLRTILVPCSRRKRSS